MAKTSVSNQGGLWSQRSAVYVVVFYTLISAVLIVIPDIGNAALGGMLFSGWKQMIRYFLCGILTISGLALWRGIARNDRGLLAIWIALYSITTVILFLIIGIGLGSGQFNLYFPNYTWGFWKRKSWLEDAMVFFLIVFAGLDVLSLRTVFKQYKETPKLKSKI